MTAQFGRPATSEQPGQTTGLVANAVWMIAVVLLLASIGNQLDTIIQLLQQQASR